VQEKNKPVFAGEGGRGKAQKKRNNREKRKKKPTTEEEENRMSLRKVVAKRFSRGKG